MTHLVAIYAQASAAFPAQIEQQITSLRQIAGERAWTVVAIHIDSLAGKAGGRRPGLPALLRGIEGGAYDAVVIEALKLVGRDLADLVAVLTTIQAAKVRFIARAEAIDTAEDGCHGLLEVGVLFAAYLRFAKRERVVAGQQAARQRGQKFGRPPLPTGQVKRVAGALSAGKGIREAGRLAGVSPTSVLRIRDGMVMDGRLAAGAD